MQLIARIWKQLTCKHVFRAEPGELGYEQVCQCGSRWSAIR